MPNNDILEQLSAREADLLVRLQGGIANKPGVLQTARALSRFGEHSLGWLALSAVGVGVDKQNKRKWCALGISAFSAHAASVIIKRVVRRPRPHDGRICVGVGTPSKLSFPSSHATSTAAALAMLAAIRHSPWPLAGIPVMMVSRMVLGVHYPSDTVAGVFLGASTAHLVNAWMVEHRAR